MEPAYAKIIQMKNYFLEGTKIGLNSYSIRVCLLQDGIATNMYEAQVNLEILHKCSLTEFSDLQEYLSESGDNHELNLQHKYLKIMATTSVRSKKNFVELAKLDLKDVESRDEFSLQSGLALCRASRTLSDVEIKKILVAIISRLDKAGKQQNEVVDSIISKIGIVSQKNQYLQIRFSAEIEEMRQAVLNTTQEFGLTFKIIQRQVQDVHGFYQDLSEQIRSQSDKNNKRFQFQLQTTKDLVDVASRQIREVSKSLGLHLAQCEVFSQKYSDKITKLDERVAYVLKALEPHNLEQGTKLKILNKSKLQEQPSYVEKRTDFLKLFTIPNSEKLKYRIDGAKLQRVGPDTQSSGVVGSQLISAKNKYKFKIIKTDAWGVSIGIKDMKNSEIIKYGGNGWISNCSSTIYSQGKGLSSGDVLVMTIDIEKSEIRWEVENRQTRYAYETKCSNSKIAAKDRQWFPFMTVSIGDCVQML